ncbi:DUF1961 family protein [bacterium]|nr:DUF1961 family protein [bacterium]
MTGMLVFLNIFILHCSKDPEQQPFLSYSGYDTRCIFTENFTGTSPKWRMEGAGHIQTGTDSTLTVRPVSDTLGTVIWLEKDIEGDFLLEYQVAFLDTSGMHILFISAAGNDGKDLFDLKLPRTGAYDTYTHGNVRNYQVSMHSYTNEGRHMPQSRMRKNPGSILLSHLGMDPCKSHRQYIIDFVKTGNRLQLYVDGVPVHDVKDKASRQNFYEDGKIGFWFQGKPGDFSVILSDIHIYKLIPN